MKKPAVHPELLTAVARPDNKVCADCGTKGTSWACVNLGVFVCTECSSVHRKLGVHISVVKSLTLDTWKPDWISMCTKVGNQIARNYYEHQLPLDFPRPGETGGFAEGIEEWIRNKYERKQYAPSCRGQKCQAPYELVQKGEDPDIYPQDGDGKGEDLVSKEEPANETQAWAHFEPTQGSLFVTLSDYYARVGQCKSAAQINLIIEKYKDNVSTLFAQLEKKYGQRVQQWADFSSPECSLLQPTELLLSDVFTGVGGHVLGSVAVSVQERQPNNAIMEPEAPTEPKAENDRLKQQVEVLQSNLSSLYQQPSHTLGAHVSTNGANYGALMEMQPTALQMAWPQNMLASPSMGSSMLPLAMTHQPLGVAR